MLRGDRIDPDRPCMFGDAPGYDGMGGGRRALAWMPSNFGAVLALSLAQDELHTKSRDLIRRYAWAVAGIEMWSSTSASTQRGMVLEQATREAVCDGTCVSRPMQRVSPTSTACRHWPHVPCPKVTRWRE